MQLKFKNSDIIIEKSNNSDDEYYINGEKKNITVKRLNSNTLKVSDDDSNYIVYHASDDLHHYVYINGESYIFDKVIDEEKVFGDSANSLDKLVLKPPMPGTIVQVPVNVGDKVDEGDPLIILEAMKMETTLYSPIKGIVTEINAVKGEQVAADKVLLIVEKE